MVSAVSCSSTHAPKKAEVIFFVYFFTYVVYAFGVKLLHPFRYFFGIFIGYAVKQAFQIAGNQYIHRRRNGLFKFTAFVINAGVDEIGKYIMLLDAQ